MWLMAEYQPVTLFSFRFGAATSSGAKTLFLPTPFAIRVALLDAAIRTEGVAKGPMAFDWIKKLSIAIRPPERLVVTNLFVKILKPTRKKKAEQTMDRTIAFREYTHLEGTIALAFSPAEERARELTALLAQINYFGKRGGFFQLTGVAQLISELPRDFIFLDGIFFEKTQVKGQWPVTFVPGLIQVMDDWGEDLTFSKVNIYSDEKIQMDKDRIRKNIILPYRLVRSSKGFSYYERMDFLQQ